MVSPVTQRIPPIIFGDGSSFSCFCFLKTARKKTYYSRACEQIDWTPKSPTSPGGGYSRVHPLVDGHSHRSSTDFRQTLLGGHLTWHGGCWVSTSPSRYFTTFGEACVPTLGLKGGVGCNPRVTSDGKVRNMGLRKICFVSSRQPTVSATTANSAGGLRLDPRHQCLPRIEVRYEGRQTAKTSKVGLSYHQRQGSSPHSRQA